MAAGTVTVADDGAVTKSGAAGRLFDLRLAEVVAATSGGVPTGPAGAAVKQAIAMFSRADATWLVTELTAQTAASVANTLAGLQRTPNPNDPATATLAPVGTVTIPLAHTT